MFFFKRSKFTMLLTLGLVGWCLVRGVLAAVDLQEVGSLRVGLVVSVLLVMMAVTILWWRMEVRLKRKGEWFTWFMFKLILMRS